jgi:GH15 family glucan-1,4-alpha-glucosidase
VLETTDGPAAIAVQNLDLFPIGNCAASALIDRRGRFVWACVPRVDGDPFFSALLRDGDADEKGLWEVAVEDAVATEQAYLRNTAVLRTVITARSGAVLEMLDFCPRAPQYGRIYRPLAFIRLLRPLAGAPRIRIRLRPTVGYGEADCERTVGSNHMRYMGGETTLRLTTDAPIGHVAEERTFRLEAPVAMFLGPDETFEGDVASACERLLTETVRDWRSWVRTLATPLDWQEVVIRAAITLKLCAHEETGAIVAALTTSIPEHADDSGEARNWDYRYCWLRDAYYVVQALNRLGAADLLENYLSYLRNLVDQTAPRSKAEESGSPSATAHIQPVYGVGLEPVLTEWIAPALAGYRGMGPVRIGNQAHVQTQHDVYGQIVLSTVQAFFDQRLLRPANEDDFRQLEPMGDCAFAVYDKPDAGLWEFRGRKGVHTYSAVMCWAACDRLANAAIKLGLADRAQHWTTRAATIRDAVEARAWNAELGRYAATFDGDELDASLLQLIDLRFCDPGEPRMRATIEAVEAGLRRGDFMLRYAIPDDFGAPKTAFNFCTFWLIEALYHSGRADEARAVFEQMLTHLSAAGLLSEDIAFDGSELWGNYPQTYSLVGLINCATLLSRPWSSVR